MYGPQNASQFRAAAGIAACGARGGGGPIVGPVRLLLIAWMRRPKKLMRRSIPDHHVVDLRKPDVDNLLKPVMDGLVQGGFLGDDAHVFDATVVKLVAEKGGCPRAWVGVQWIPGWRMPTS